MERPNFITQEDINRWTQNLENDKKISKHVLNNDYIKEVCFAGMFMVEELQKLKCSDDMIVRMQYTAGKLSFGRNPWDVSQIILQKFKDNDLTFEESYDDNN
jgi:hypothetical protein